MKFSEKMWKNSEGVKCKLPGVECSKKCQKFDGFLIVEIEGFMYRSS